MAEAVHAQLALRVREVPLDAAHLRGLTNWIMSGLAIHFEPQACNEPSQSRTRRKTPLHEQPVDPWPSTSSLV
eukprot:CAMPEP_0171132474 /NCGR_PEP_ID=MMETSP0766_2-20121228/124634_1 /TAXON_ID=439317 /ORGANISM="Gambierdiscus australes, Strain CAWD 149" /LENGTH=72 /DNA_ID=CAMNT_0011595817 /DNA_START=116 /DNA_END=331 /DNA_ORIENTATION=-